MKEEKELTITISREPSYDKHKLVMHLDLDRTIKFNKGEKIEVTQAELDELGSPKPHRWVIVHKTETPKKYVKKDIKEEGEI